MRKQSSPRKITFYSTLNSTFVVSLLSATPRNNSEKQLSPLRTREKNQLHAYSNPLGVAAAVYSSSSIISTLPQLHIYTSSRIYASKWFIPRENVSAVAYRVFFSVVDCAASDLSRVRTLASCTIRRLIYARARDYKRGRIFEGLSRGIGAKPVLRRSAREIMELSLALPTSSAARVFDRHCVSFL